MVDTIRTEANLLAAIFQDGQSAGSITPQDLRDLVVSVSNKQHSGYFIYADTLSASAPISIPAGNEVKLTNDGIGTSTNNIYRPDTVSATWNTTTNQLDFSETSMGSQATIQVTLEITTTAPNTDISLDLYTGLTGIVKRTSFDIHTFATTGTYNITRQVSLHCGDTNIKDNPGELRITSNFNSSVVVKEFYITVNMR